MSDEDLKTKVQDLTMDIGNLKVDIFAMNGKISEIVEVLSKSAEAASAVKGIEELELRMFHDPNDMKVRSGIRPGAAGAVRLGAAGAGAGAGGAGAGAAGAGAGGARGGGKRRKKSKKYKKKKSKKKTKRRR